MVGHSTNKDQFQSEADGACAIKSPRFAWTSLLTEAKCRKSVKPMGKRLANDLSAFGRYRPQVAIARLLDLTRGASASWAVKRGAFFLRSMAMKALKG